MPTAGSGANLESKPSKENLIPSLKQPETVTKSTKSNDPAVEKNGVGVKIPTTSLNMTEEFKCRVNDIYNCFIELPVSFENPILND